MASQWTMSSLFALLTSQTFNLLVILTGQIRSYLRIPIVMAPVTFGSSRQKESLLLGSRYFQAAVIFGWLKMFVWCSNSQSFLK